MRPKIGICGAPSTGKTALAQRLSKLLTLPLIYQGAREVRAIGRPEKPTAQMNELERLRWQLNLIDYRISREHEMAEFVADGTALDLLAWYRHCSFLVPFSQKAATENLLIQAAARYDYIFYCPLWIDVLASAPPDEKDPVTVDAFNIETIDFLLKGIVSMMANRGSKLYVLQRIDPDERVVEIAEALSDALGLKLDDVKLLFSKVAKDSEQKEIVQ